MITDILHFSEPLHVRYCCLYSKTFVDRRNKEKKKVVFQFVKMQACAPNCDMLSNLMQSTKIT